MSGYCFPLVVTAEEIVEIVKVHLGPSNYEKGRREEVREGFRITPISSERD